MTNKKENPGEEIVEYKDELGLYNVYEIIKTDGSPMDPKADYFVLRLDKDEDARGAMIAYEELIREKKPNLARDLRAKLRSYGAFGYLDINGTYHLTLKNPGEVEFNTISKEHICKSAAGYYLGTMESDPECGGAIIPYARFSAEYWPTREEAEVAIESGKWTPKM